MDILHKSSFTIIINCRNKIIKCIEKPKEKRKKKRKINWKNKFIEFRSNTYYLYQLTEQQQRQENFYRAPIFGCD